MTIRNIGELLKPNASVSQHFILKVFNYAIHDVDTDLV